MAFRRRRFRRSFRSRLRGMAGRALRRYRGRRGGGRRGGGRRRRVFLVGQRF